MANEVRQIYRSQIANIASGLALTANVQSGQQTTVLNQGSGQNCAGAEAVRFELVVTSGPSTATSCLLYLHPSHDGGSNYMAGRVAGAFVVPTGTGRYECVVHDLPPLAKVSLLAISYGMTVTLNAVPQLPEIQ